MEDKIQYNVVSSGKIIEEFDPLEVQGSIAELFKITPEQATSIVGKRKVLKKGLPHKDAQIYKRKLESLGVEIVLKPQDVAVKPALTLALEPMEGKAEAAPVIGESAPQLSLSEPASSQITCEKCQLSQPKSEQCIGCGVFFHKIRQAPDAPAPNSKRDTSSHDDKLSTEDTQIFSGDSFNILALVAGGIVAVLGALLWKGIAMAFDYELGFVAWGIGGAIGGVVALMGSRGQVSGAVAGVLALMAILGGKYWVVESFQAQLSDMLSSSPEQMQQVYEEQRQLANTYSDTVHGTRSLRQFMVDNDYSEYYQPGEVTDEELAYFRESVHPELEALAASDMSFDKWYSTTVQFELDHVSTVSIMKETFGAIDALFLFLGVATAFRLGRGEERFA